MKWHTPAWTLVVVAIAISFTWWSVEVLLVGATKSSGLMVR